MPVKLKHFNKKTGETTYTDYWTVAERLKLLREDDNSELFIETNLISEDENQVTIKASLVCKRGKFQGSARSYKDAPLIEGQSPLEVAETSAVGRALGFAGYGSVESIASAEEVIAANKPLVEKANGAKPSEKKDNLFPEPHYCKACGNPMKYRTGTSQKGVAWKGYFCSDRKHEAEFIHDQPENMLAEGNVPFEAAPEKAHWGGFWLRCKELGIDRPLAHKLFGQPVEDKALLRFAETRAEFENATLQDVIDDMRDELEVRKLETS